MPIVIEVTDLRPWDMDYDVCLRGIGHLPVPMLAFILMPLPRREVQKHSAILLFIFASFVILNPSVG